MAPPRHDGGGQRHAHVDREVGGEGGGALADAGGDALAAPQGRAEDVLLAPYVDLSERVRFRIGYRLLEGGADNDEVYNFALVLASTKETQKRRGTALS